MAPDALNSTLISMLTIVEARTASAHAIAAAARAAAERGGAWEAIQICLTLDEPLYEATTLSGAAVVLARATEGG
jgi:hypothetical protein